MFLILGTAPVRKIGKTLIRRNCPRCHDIRNFQEVSVRQFLSFFFIPILPISKAISIYVCPTCKFGMSAEDAASNTVSETAVFHPSPETMASGESVVIFCTRCDGPMNLPLSGHRQEVTCPHCTMEFTVKGIKEPVPDAILKSENTVDAEAPDTAIVLNPAPDSTT